MGSPAQLVAYEDAWLHILLTPDLAKTSLGLVVPGRGNDADIPLCLAFDPAIHEALPFAIGVQGVDQAEVAAPEHVTIDKGLFSAPGCLLSLNGTAEASTQP